VIGKYISWNWWAFIFWCVAMVGFVLIRIGGPLVGKVLLFFGIFAGGFCVLRSMAHYFSEKRNKE
jgi:hypothetical protein